MQKVLDFWLDMGVDGLRLDAVPYLYEREGTSCENLPETHEYLVKLRAHVDAKFPGRMLLAEANQWPEDAVAYFGKGDESHMNFHFPLMPRMFMALQMEDRFPIIDILDQTPAIPENCQWAMFLRNHDELTLEMVTDEERDYMYRVYATDPPARINLGIRRRLAPLLANSRRKIELLNILLFSMPGTPVLYYGDEIGMGDNFYLGDRNGVPHPDAMEPAIATPVFRKRIRSSSICRSRSIRNITTRRSTSRTSRRICLRCSGGCGASSRCERTSSAFSRGSLEFLHPENPKVLVFLRRFEDETILVVVNLSRFSQPVEIDLSRFAGCVPMEVFSQNYFPPIKKAPYLITLGPHAHYWFAFRSQAAKRATKKRVVPVIEAEPDLSALLHNNHRARFEREILPRYLRIAAGSARKREAFARCASSKQIPVAEDAGQLWFLQVITPTGHPRFTALPVQIATGPAAEALAQATPQAVIARVGDKGVLHDAIWDPEFREQLFQLMASGAILKGRGGQLVGLGSSLLAQEPNDKAPPSQVLSAEQSNSSMLFENRFFLKLYRKLEDGMNPDVEITRFLRRTSSSRTCPHLLARSNIGVRVPSRPWSRSCRRPRLTKATRGR